LLVLWKLLMQLLKQLKVEEEEELMQEEQEKVVDLGATMRLGAWPCAIAPGTAARFDCAGRSAVVLRTRAGDLHGFRNACRHRGTRLVEGDPHTGLAFCVDGRFRCPYHGWTYDETGALVAIGAESDPLAEGHTLELTYDWIRGHG
jgi:nitrite reductase/ring-hydroxylating ferredoxin subunit